MQRRLALLSLCLASREASSHFEEASEDLDRYGSVPWINTVGDFEFESGRVSQLALGYAYSGPRGQGKRSDFCGVSTDDSLNGRCARNWVCYVLGSIETVCKVLTNGDPPLSALAATAATVSDKFVLDPTAVSYISIGGRAVCWRAANGNGVLRTAPACCVLLHFRRYGRHLLCRCRWQVTAPS